jgi:hypothetical protein
LTESLRRFTVHTFTTQFLSRKGQIMLKMLCVLQMLAGDLRERVSSRLSEEKGASTVEWVIITGFLIVLAAVVGKAIYSMVNDASANLKVPEIGNGGGDGAP